VATMLIEEGVVEELARREQERLQGRWVFMSGIREAELLIMGNLYTVRFKNGDAYRGRFTLDPTHKPKSMDMRIIEGPARHLGKVARAIYALDGKHLIWCPNKPGLEEPLPFFPPPDDQEHLCIVFRRADAAA
jgi:uncharacterized protein (TIGR03067 family)